MNPDRQNDSASTRHSWRSILSESFIPVMAVLFALFLLLLFIQFKIEFDADRTVVIDIAADSGTAADPGTENEPITPVLVAENISDKEFANVEALLRAFEYTKAERLATGIIERDGSAETVHTIGVLYFRAGKINAALRYFSQAISTGPGYPRAYYSRGVVHTTLKQFDAALPDYLAATRALPNHYEAHFNLGMTWLRKKQYPAAAVAFEKAARLTGGVRKSRALYRQGLSIVKQGGRVQATAAKLFERAIRLRPDYIDARYQLAVLEPATPEGQARALVQYGNILSLQPNHVRSLINSAALTAENGDTEAAIALLRDAIKYSPKNLTAHLMLGQRFLAVKQWQAAKREFQWFLKRKPLDARAQFYLGRAVFGRKDFDRAIAVYRKAIDARGGNFPEAYLNMGLAYMAKRKYSKAVKANKKAISQRQDYPEAWFNLGLAYLRSRRSRSAIEPFKNAVKHRPEYAEAWYNMGIAYTRQNRDEDAIAVYREALRIRPNYRKVQLNLAVRLAQQGNKRDAIQLYREVLSVDATYASAWHNIGLAYRDTGQLDEAEDALRNVLKLEPENVKARAVLSNILLQKGRSGEAIELMEDAVAMETANTSLRLTLAKALDSAGRRADAQAELRKAQRLNPDSKLVRKALDNLLTRQSAE